MSVHDRILEAAEARLRSNGYGAVSFRDLANDVGVKSASVHYHFPRKEDLGVAVVAAYTKKVFEALGMAGQGKTPHDRLGAYIGVFRHALVQENAICLCAMLGAEARGLPVQVADAVRVFFQANIDWLDEALADAVSKPKSAEIIAALEGAMLLANTMDSIAMFEDVASGLLKRVE